MPGPTRFFTTNAARQRAYRRRKQEEANAELEEAQDTTTYAYLLHAAVKEARREGDPVAENVYRDNAFDLLRALVDHFYDQAGTPALKRPWQKPPEPTPPEAQTGSAGALPAAPDSQLQGRR